MPTTQAGKKVRVGIVDTGVSPDHHTDLFGQVEYAGEAADELGHGTAVAGVVQQVFSAHVAAEHPELYAYKVIDGTGHGTLWGVLQALDRAAADSMDVVNLSLGFSGVDCVEAVQAYLDEQFATYPFELVVSAGNSSLDLDRRARLPATSTAENVLVVGAMDRQQHELAAWSNYGTNNVDYLTLGDHVSVPNHASSTFLEVSGTSFSAPIVTGLLAALLTQYDRGEALRQLAELVEPNLHSGNTAIGSIPFREDDCPAFPEAVAGGTAVAVELYPNPFVDRLMLTLPQNETGCRIALFGTSGQLVYAKNLPAGVVSSNIATQELPRGSYVLTITSQYTHETHLVRRE
ncbi:S8 family serine peptidase [Neolewinella maritima]|nr:S8 family serine peptidase [Neolewinella maritima]